MRGIRQVRGRLLAAIAVAGVALTIPFTAGATPPTPPAVNGSFEAGNTSGWAAVIPSGGSINVLPGGAPGGGSFFARLKTNGPGSFTTLTQTVTASQGDFIKGSARFVNNDPDGCSGFNDNAQVHIKQGATTIGTPFAAQSCGTPLGAGPWVDWQLQAPADGSYTVEIRIANAGDSIFDSQVDADNVRVHKALRNGSFEDGNTDGWVGAIPVGGSINVLAGGAPGAGSSFARLKTNGPGSFTTLSQAVSLAAGEGVSGSARFINNDPDGCFGFNDNTQVHIRDSGGAVVATPFAKQSCGTPLGTGPWTNWSFTASSAGVYTIEARIANAGDSIFDSQVDLDGVKIGVADTTAPVLTLPGNITAEATSSAGAVVTYSATATDNVDGAITPACSPASGGTFALGTTTVSCTATDAAGNSSSGSFTVTVQDTTSPALSLPANITAEATSAAGAAVSYSASATDAVDPSPSVACSPASGGTFPLGTTTVNCTATDAAGNSSSGSFTVTVQDTTGPAVTCVNGPNPSGKNEPNGSAGFRTITATDAVGVVTLQIVDSASSFVSSNLSSGWNLKLTQSAGSASEKDMAGVVSKHINTTGAPILRAVDAAGNVTQVSC